MLRFLDYETSLVYDVLSKTKENANVKLEREIVVEEKVPYKADIYAPDGIPSLKIEGRTIVEVKKELSYASIQRVNAVFSSLNNDYNVLVVYFISRLTAIPKEIKGNNHFCRFYDFKEIKRTKTPPKSKEAFYLRLSRESDWKVNRDSLVSEAKAIVGNGNCALFLGAGVSMSANMPSWKELLKGLMGEVKQLKEEALEAFKELSTHVSEECGDSYLIMARYLQAAIRLHDKNIMLSELIQKHLYRKGHTSQLLKDLACIVQQRKADEVITYNFDDILEQELTNVGLQRGVDFITVSKDADVTGHEILPIYHVHGVIPETGPADIVVFSEDEYHKRYSNSFHWSNIEQLHALSRKHCFFIGLSMIDPNLRRLLDAARAINKTDNENHYAFLKRQKMEKYCLAGMDDVCKYVHVSESLIDKKKQKDIYSLNYTVLECMFRELGVKVIWYEDFDELPVLIENVFGLNAHVSMENDSLIKQVEYKQIEIRKIEDGLKCFNIANLTSEDVLKFLSYKRDNGERYRNLVSECGEILIELSNRIKSDDEILLKMQNSIPVYGNNMNGYAEFYNMWLNFIKKLLSENTK